MSKKLFNQEQINMLLQNPNVEKCSEKSITYSKDFKVAAIQQWEAGTPPQEIFRQAGFNVSIIGLEKPGACLNRWRHTFREKGVNSLKTETRGKGKGGGRKKTKWDNDKEKIKYLEAEVDYLKAENDFLAKLRKKS